MSTPTSPKSPCSTCHKIAGIFICGGCRQDFCLPHANSHRQEMDRQVDELFLDHDQLRQNLIEQINGNYEHLPLKQIDEWEKQSIEKIRQVAEEIKGQIKTVIDKQLNTCSTTLTHLTEEMKQARENQNYFERDIDEWRDKLNQLKDLLTKPKLVDLQPADQTLPLICKPSVIILDEEIIGQTSKHIRLEDNGRILIHNQQDNNHGAAHGKSEYFWGQHRVRFQIETFHLNKWIFVGILSKDIQLRDTSHASSSSYGWAPPNQVFINGKIQAGYKHYRNDWELNDTIELMLDCDRQKIRVINERTHQKWELSVDLNHCPLPWKLNFNLNYFNDRIRLLQA